MYLAKTRSYGRVTWRLRRSVKDQDRYVHQELYDLGEDPRQYIFFPGGRGFYFDHRLIGRLKDLGVRDVDDQLEHLLMPWLPADTQRIIQQMSHFRPKKRRSLSKSAMAQAQSHLHLLDRRRMYYLRFGRMDGNEALFKPHRFLNGLLEKSRDEIEQELESQERQLRLRERKQYVFHAFDLGRFFPGEFGRLFPMGLDQDRLDEAFLTEVCRVNADPEFLGEPHDPNRLCEYLIRYVILWFDFEFGQRPPQRRIFEEFMNRNRTFRPPPPAKTVDFNQACDIFKISVTEYTSMSRSQITRVYRRLALEYHPDQGGESEAFIELNQAYQRLLIGK